LHTIFTPLHFYQGLVDIDVEISKCEKKLDLALLNVDKLQKLQAQPGYEQSIPEDVRASNGEKVPRLFPV
jgi:valyl-tRNA synthetase